MQTINSIFRLTSPLLATTGFTVPVTQAPSGELLQRFAGYPTGTTVWKANIISIASPAQAHEQRVAIAEFLGDYSVLKQSDAELSQTLIKAFETGRYRHDHCLTLKNVQFTAGRVEVCVIPENVTLQDCTLVGIGVMKFHKGSLSARSAGAVAIAFGPGATAIAQAPRSMAMAVRGATAIAAGAHSVADARGKGGCIARAEGEDAQARASGEGAIAYAKGITSVARATGPGAKAYAAGLASVAEAVQGAQAYVVESGTMAIAKDEGSEAWALRKGSEAVAENGAKAFGVGALTTVTVRNHSEGFARGPGSVVLAENSSVAIAEADSTRASALDTSSTAQAMVPTATAQFSTDGQGSVFQALGEIDVPALTKVR